MSDADALRAAFELLRLPSQVRVARARPLPPNTQFLLRIAARDRDAERDAQSLSEHTLEDNRQAAIFFIEQVLLGPESDSLRVLGFNEDVPLFQLRKHMALLLKWLHPDIGCDEPRAAMARRVIEAWNNLKDDARRCAPSHRGIQTPMRAATSSKPLASPRSDVGERNLTEASPLARGWRLRRLLDSYLRRARRRAHFMLSD